jgi:hypothetical protein
MTEEERIIYTRRLADAREKRHLLITGQAVEQYIDQNGEQIKYTKMNLAKLDDYIVELCGLLNPALAAAAVKRPLRFVF